MFCCLKGCLNGFTLSPSVPARPKENPIQLDTSHMAYLRRYERLKMRSLGRWTHTRRTAQAPTALDVWPNDGLYDITAGKAAGKKLVINTLGHEVVVVKGGTRVCGSGCALGNAPLVQSKAYFEVKLQQGGVWAVGLAARDTDLDRVHGGMDKWSWCLNGDGTVRHDNVELYQLSPARRDSPADLQDLLVDSPAPAADPYPAAASPAACGPAAPAEGDVVGVSYDHIELNFFLNGKNMEIPVRNVKGTVYPALYVDDGAILDVILENFLYPPPSGFERIMIEQSLL